MKNPILIIVIFAVVGVAALLFLGVFSQNQSTTEQPSSQDIKAQQSPAATLPKTLYNLTGIVRTVQKDSLIFEAKIPEIADDGSLVYKLENKTVYVSLDTDITKLIFVQDTETNQRKLQELNVSLSSLARGDVIEVVSRTEVRDTDEISATQIRLLP